MRLGRVREETRAIAFRIAELINRTVRDALRLRYLDFRPVHKNGAEQRFEGVIAMVLRDAASDIENCLKRSARIAVVVPLFYLRDVVVSIFPIDWEKYCDGF